LSGGVYLVGQIEDVQTDVISNIGKINLFIRSQTELDNMLTFLSSDTGDSSHDFFNVVVDIAKVTTNAGVPHDISDIFHGVGTVVGRDGARFSDGVDVSHVSDGRGGDGVNRAHVFVDFFISNY